MGICKFCGQEKKLIKAHIIPKKFYLGRYLCINSKTKLKEGAITAPSFSFYLIM